MTEPRYLIRDHKTCVLILDSYHGYQVVWHSETGRTKHAGVKNIDLAKQWVEEQA